MAGTIYQNNDVVIILEPVDSHEAKVNINGKNLMWISLQEADEFKRELSALLDKYRI